MELIGTKPTDAEIAKLEAKGYLKPISLYQDLEDLSLRLYKLEDEVMKHHSFDTELERIDANIRVLTEKLNAILSED